MSPVTLEISSASGKSELEAIHPSNRHQCAGSVLFRRSLADSPSVGASPTPYTIAARWTHIIEVTIVLSFLRVEVLHSPVQRFALSLTVTTTFVSFLPPLQVSESSASQLSPFRRFYQPRVRPSLRRDHCTQTTLLRNQ